MMPHGWPAVKHFRLCWATKWAAMRHMKPCETTPESGGTHGATWVWGSKTPGVTWSHPSEWLLDTWNKPKPPQWRAMEDLGWHWATPMRCSRTPVTTTWNHFSEWQWNTCEEAELLQWVAVKHIILHRVTPVNLSLLGWHEMTTVSNSDILQSQQPQ